MTRLFAPLKSEKIGARFDARAPFIPEVPGRFERCLHSADAKTNHAAAQHSVTQGYESATDGAEGDHYTATIN
jgi:hypothetical protein